MVKSGIQDFLCRQDFNNKSLNENKLNVNLSFDILPQGVEQLQVLFLAAILAERRRGSGAIEASSSTGSSISSG